MEEIYSHTASFSETNLSHKPLFLHGALQNQMDSLPSPDSYPENQPTTATLASSPPDALPYECKLHAQCYALVTHLPFHRISRPQTRFNQ